MLEGRTNHIEEFKDWFTKLYRDWKKKSSVEAASLTDNDTAEASSEEDASASSEAVKDDGTPKKKRVGFRDRKVFLLFLGFVVIIRG